VVGQKLKITKLLFLHLNCRYCQNKIQLAIRDGQKIKGWVHVSAMSQAAYFIWREGVTAKLARTPAMWYIYSNNLVYAKIYRQRFTYGLTKMLGGWQG